MFSYVFMLQYSCPPTHGDNKILNVVPVVFVVEGSFDKLQARISQKYSIGDKSANLGGHGKT